VSPERPEALTVALLIIGIFEQLGIEYHVGRLVCELRAIELRASFNVLHLASGVKVDIF